MTIHLQKEIEKLKKKILSLCALVEDNVRKAIISVEKKNVPLAKEVIETDHEIDAKEVEIEEECLKNLALHQPVAVDLRFIVAVLKINNDLERIGDLAVNIAERGLYLAGKGKVSFAFSLSEMGEKVLTMLRKSLDALVSSSPDLAREVCAADDEVDAINRDVYKQARGEVPSGPEGLNILMHQISISRHLERTADLTTNIAEDVIYMAEGEIVRHRGHDYE